MTYAIAKHAHAALNAEVDRLGAALRAFPKGPNGLTPDHVKFSPEYRAAKAAFDDAFARARAFNAAYVKTYAKELRAERLAGRR